MELFEIIIFVIFAIVALVGMIFSIVAYRKALDNSHRLDEKADKDKPCNPDLDCAHVDSCDVCISGFQCKAIAGGDGTEHVCQ